MKAPLFFDVSHWHQNNLLNLPYIEALGSGADDVHQCILVALTINIASGLF